MRARSRVDGWLAVVIGGSLLLSVLSAVHALLQEGAAGVLVAVVVAVTWLGVGLLTVPVHYTVDANELVIRSGLILKRIPLSTIKRVYPTRSSMASFACSLDRIAVHYGQGFKVLISPIRKQEFLRRLTKAAGLVRSGREWVRDAETR